MSKQRSYNAELIRRERDRRGWSQEHLADLVGVSQRTISSLERGATDRPSAELLGKVARALDLDVGRLLFLINATGVGSVQPVGSASATVGDAEPERRDPTLEELLEQLQSKVREIEQPVRVPVLGTRAHAHFVPGFPIDLGNFNIVRHISAGSEFAGRNVFGVDVAGDCLEPRVEDGDLALFEWGSRVGDGDYAVAVHEGVLIIKQARVVDGRVVALYDRYSDEPDGEEIVVNGHTTILGRVVQFRRDV